ncbi:MAG: RnfABCDGE type electron transport complex subunit C, partial [bacterium]
FPTHVKLSPPEGKRIDTVIINGAECEPCLTSDHRLMLERSNEIVAGLRIMMRILGASQGLIAIERNKPDAIEKMKQEVKGEDSIGVVDLKVKYPQGAEKQLIHAVTGREVPCGGLPMDVGCLVQNVGTSCAIYQAIRFGRPLLERVLTVSGSAIKSPGNYLVRIGSRFCDVINQAGGVIEDPGKVIMGGPMMGIAQHRDDVPVIKGTSGIIVLRQRDVSAYVSQACIRCGRCVNSCPMWLMPNEIARSVEKGLIQRANIFGLMDCMECGVCAYVCPSKINHVHLVKLGKAEVFAMRKRGVEAS